jgi:hypothetical protein
VGRVAERAGELLAGDHSEFSSSRVVGASFCEHPIRLWGYGHNLETGERKGEAKFVRCKTRRRSKCLACSELYERDAYTVAASGWREQTPFAWITLTAPGREVFGCQHHTWAGRDGSRRCTPRRKCPGCGTEVAACRRFHKSGDPLIGVPVCECFDYEEAAAFNASVPALWTETLNALNAAFPQPAERHKVRSGEHRGEVVMRPPRLAFIKVAEWQRRGLIHIHALVRGIDDADKLAEVVSAVSANGHSWGENSRVEVISPTNEEKARTKFSYLVKYSTKTVADHQVERSPLLLAHLERIRAAASPDCSCSDEQRADGEHWTVCRRARARSEGLGFGGHVLTKSQTWGESFLSIRLARRRWAFNNHSGDAWEWVWQLDGQGYEWETNDQAEAAALFFRALRGRSRAPAPWLERFAFLGSIEDEDGVESFSLDPHGRLLSSSSLMYSVFEKIG